MGKRSRRELLKQGHKADSGAFRGITLLGTIGRAFYGGLNHIVALEEENISEDQANSGPNRSRVNEVFTVGEVIPGREDAGLAT